MMPAVEPGMPMSFVVRVLLLHEGEFWVAQGLEYDVAAQGRSPEETKAAFERTFIGRLVFDLERGRQPLAGVDRAPAHYWVIAERLTAHQDTLSPPERITAPARTSRALTMPPAFMIPIIQPDNYAHS